VNSARGMPVPRMIVPSISPRAPDVANAPASARASVSNPAPAQRGGTAPAAQKPVTRLPDMPPMKWSVSDAEGVWYIYAPHWATRAAGVLVCLQKTYVKRTTAMSWELPEWGKREALMGQELRIAEQPTFVTDPKEKTRHKWIHLHRCVKLGEMERAKAELIEARRKLNSANTKLKKVSKADDALSEAQRHLELAKQKLRRELAEREKLGLKVDVDPFSPDFHTGPTDEQNAKGSSEDTVLEPPAPVHDFGLTPFSYSAETGLTGGLVPSSQLR